MIILKFLVSLGVYHEYLKVHVFLLAFFISSNFLVDWLVLFNWLKHFFEFSSCSLTSVRSCWHWSFPGDYFNQYLNGSCRINLLSFGNFIFYFEWLLVFVGCFQIVWQDDNLLHLITSHFSFLCWIIVTLKVFQMVISEWQSWLKFSHRWYYNYKYRGDITGTGTFIQLNLHMFKQLPQV